MALWLLKGSNRISRFPISIYSDSQAFVKAVRAQRASPGYRLIKEFTGFAEDLVSDSEPTRHSHRITLRWIAAHKDVKGNEKADLEAKRAAAAWESSPSEHLPYLLRDPLPLSTGIAKAEHLNRLREEWRGTWNRSPRRERLEKIDDAFPYEKHRKRTDFLTRVQCSLLFQIRSNHLPLNCYLHRIGKLPSKRCDSCWRRYSTETPETVTHFLFECPAFNYERQDLDRALGITQGTSRPSSQR